MATLNTRYDLGINGLQPFPLLRSGFTTHSPMLGLPAHPSTYLNDLHAEKISDIQATLIQIENSSGGLLASLPKINELNKKVAFGKSDSVRENNYLMKNRYEMLEASIRRVVDTLARTPIVTYSPAISHPAPSYTPAKELHTYRSYGNLSTASTAPETPRTPYFSNPSPAVSRLVSPAYSTVSEPVTQSRADRIVQQLYKMEDFVWDYKVDGCYARAALAIDELKKMGISESRLTNQVISGPNLGVLLPNGENITWKYHIAATVELDDGQQVVIDPSVNSQRALSIQEWASRIKKDNSPLPPTSTFINKNTGIDHNVDLSKYSFAHIPSDGTVTKGSTYSTPGCFNYRISKVDTFTKQHFREKLAENKMAMENSRIQTYRLATSCATEYFRASMPSYNTLPTMILV